MRNWADPIAGLVAYFCTRHLKKSSETGIIEIATNPRYIAHHVKNADHNYDHYHLPFRGTDGRDLIASTATRFRVDGVSS